MVPPFNDSVFLQWEKIRIRGKRYGRGRRLRNRGFACRRNGRRMRRRGWRGRTTLRIGRENWRPFIGCMGRSFGNWPRRNTFASSSIPRRTKTASDGCCHGLKPTRRTLSFFGFRPTAAGCGTLVRSFLRAISPRRKRPSPGFDLRAGPAIPIGKRTIASP